MSLLVALAVVAGGVVAARYVARRVRSRASVVSPSEGGVALSRSDGLAALPCQLGDVVVRSAGNDEAWLAGALVFEEDRPVAALFVAPEAGGDRALWVREAAEEVAWLSPLAARELVVSREPPHVIEHAGSRFERARRLPVAVRRLGSGAPAVGDRAIVAEYAGPAAERIIIVAGSEQTLAWVGVELTKAEYDVLPGGKATLE